MRLFFVPLPVLVQSWPLVRLNFEREPLEYLKLRAASESAQLSCTVDGQLQKPGESLHDPLLAAFVLYRFDPVKCEINASGI
jgi:hypothetical protein